jgi:hypothetical protein
MRLMATFFEEKFVCRTYRASRLLANLFGSRRSVLPSRSLLVRPVERISINGSWFVGTSTFMGVTNRSRHVLKVRCVNPGGLRRFSCTGYGWDISINDVHTFKDLRADVVSYHSKRGVRHRSQEMGGGLLQFHLLHGTVN